MYLLFAAYKDYTSHYIITRLYFIQAKSTDILTDHEISKDSEQLFYSFWNGVKRGSECEVVGQAGGDAMPWEGEVTARPQADVEEGRVGRLQADPGWG